MEQLIRRASPLVPIAVLLVAMVSFQSGASIAKTMLPVVGAVGMVTLRTVLGTLILGVTLRPWRVRVTPEARRPLIVYGLSLGGMNLLFYAALGRIPLGIVVALEFTGPLAVAVWGSRRVVDYWWITLAVAGLLLLLPLTGATATLDPLGVVYALAAGGCWVLYIVYGQKAGADHGAQTVALGSAISSIVVVPLGLLVSGSILFSRSALLPGLGVAILSTALPYTLEMFALTRMATRTFGILMSLEPALAAIMGLLLLGEQLTLVQWLAILLIIMASVGTTVTSQRKVATALAD